MGHRKPSTRASCSESCGLCHASILPVCPGDFAYIVLAPVIKVPAYPHPPLQGYRPSQFLLHRWPHLISLLLPIQTPSASLATVFGPRKSTPGRGCQCLLPRLGHLSSQHLQGTLSSKLTLPSSGAVFILCLGTFSSIGSLVTAVGVGVEGGLPPPGPILSQLGAEVGR